MSSTDKKRLKLVTQTIKDEVLIKQMLESLECPVCMETMHPPIFMCQTGHNVCENCRSGLITPRCPLCTSAITNQRNFSLEMITEKTKQLQFLCPNAVDGCSVRLPNSQMQQHVTNCSYRPFVCTMHELGECTHKVTFANFLEHFVCQHPNNVIYDIGAEMILNKSDLVDGYGNVHLITLQSNLFIYQIDIDVNDKLARWTVQYVGLKDEARKWFFRITTSDGKGINSLDASARCSTLSRTSYDIFYNGHCIGISVNILKNFLREDKNLYFKLQIEPIVL